MEPLELDEDLNQFVGRIAAEIGVGKEDLGLFVAPMLEGLRSIGQDAEIYTVMPQSIPGVLQMMVPRTRIRLCAPSLGKGVLAGAFALVLSMGFSGGSLDASEAAPTLFTAAVAAVSILSPREQKILAAVASSSRKGPSTASEQIADIADQLADSQVDELDLRSLRDKNLVFRSSDGIYHVSTEWRQ